MSFEAASRSATKKNFAEKFAKELESHLVYGDKLAKSLSNPNIANAPDTSVEDQDLQQALNAYAYSAAKSSNVEENPSFTARIRDYIQQHQSQKVTAFDAEPHGAYRDNDSDYNTPERKETLGRNVQYSTNQQQDDSVQALDEINAKNYSTLQERYDQQNRSSASSRQAYSSNEGSRLSLNLPKRIQQNPAGDNRRDTSPVLNSSENLSHVAEVKRSGSAHLESASYLFPNAEKNTSFKKKIISDSMQRLKSSVYNSGAPTRDNSIKSGLFHEPEHTQSQAENTKKMEHELALRQMLANTSLTYENGDAKSSDDSFHTAHDRSHSMSIKKMDSMLDKMQASRDQPLSERSIIPRGNGRLEDDGSIIQLRELFRNSANEANASKLSLKKNSHPNTGRSPRDSCTASQLFRPSESESYVMNVSRLGELDDPAEIQERIEELRRYSMELGMGWNPEQNAPEPVKEVAYNRRNPSDIGESSSANEHENTRYMSSNTVEGMKSLRTPDFQSYASQMKDNHFFALHNQQDNARNGAGAQKRNNSNEGKKKSIINKFSKELEKGLASRLPVPQPRPIDPQESSEYPESQEMMGFLSFSKEHGRTDASETLHSPDKYGYDASVSYSRELPERSNLRRALQEEEKERAQNSFAMEKKLAEASNKVNIKTFLALRSILKPHRAIVLCCEGLVKLLSGFDDIPANLEEQESVEWGQIKALFNSPVKIVNLVSTFKTLANSGKITAQKIEAVELVLSRIQVHLDTPQHEAFSQLHSFLVAAVQYYESCFQDTYYNIRRETFEEPEKTAPVPMQYTAAPQNKPRIPTASNNVYKPVASGSRKSPLQSRYSQGKYSPQKVEPNKVQRQSKSVGRVRPPSDKKDRENQGNTSNITRNSGQNFRKEEQTRSTQQDKSASKTPTKKNVSSKIDNKRVVLGQKSLENNYMKEKEIYEDNEMSGDGVRFLVDVEQSEAGELKDTIEAKEKEAREYRNKVKKMLFEHDRFVKKFLKQQEDLEDEINREFATEDWRRTNQMKQEQEEFERDWKHQRNMDYITEKKEVKENQDRENKENMNEELLEGLQDHYYHQFTVQTKKENKKKQLREKYQSLLADKISKKQKETMESISQKEELAQSRRDHFKSRKIDIENEKNKWQSDYLMLSKLIGDAK